MEARTNEQPLCFLCVEPLDSWTIQRSCCHNELCQSCFYRHIKSIVEGAGDFRELTCPFGCRKQLTDGEIRECFQRQHQPSWFMAILRWLYYAVACLLSPSHFVWWHTCLTRNERRDLERYAAWSLQRGLADLSKKNDSVIILQCPGVDCSFQWIVADPQHRRAKQRHERKAYWLWYAPYRVAENTPDSFLFGPNSFSILGLNRNGDPRKMVCPACMTSFCGLCRNPWTFGSADHSYRACREYTQRLPTEDNLEDRFALANIGRTCPGCSRRTERISGCNHMTCLCGMEWCYSCEKRWNPTHYACSEQRDAAPPCTIL
mmetsp:Transcript_18730/g.35586  ORF Transcript_18730/g.35586 Transcript_18730/m.35586 type:complete len:318 (-) Transcript_18730:43-996(-)